MKETDALFFRCLLVKLVAESQPAFIGGVGTTLGPFLGALFYILVREGLAISFTQFHQIIFGVLFVLIVLLLPGGLIDAWRRLRGRRSWGSEV